MLDEEGLEAEEDWKKADYINALLEVEIDDDEEDDEDDDVEEDEVDDEEDDEEDDDEESDEEEDEIEPEPAPKKTRTAKKKTDDKGENTLAAKQVATLLEVDAKTLRQFFRSTASTIQPVGSGGRYEFAEADVPKIREEFAAWKAGHASRGAKRTGEGKSTRKRGGKNKPVEAVDEVEEVEELEIEELEDPDEDLELDDEEDD